jgi:purine-binding chemotaxis protein CheW
MKETASNINSYLTFKLGDEIFGANVSKVLNILEMTKITKVPKAPSYMKGVINLRGAVLPLIDTRIKFDMGETQYTTNTCILVLDIDMGGESVHVGALVDSVQEVLEIDDASIQPPPSIGSKYKSEFIEGMAKVDDEFIMLLNMDLIFSTDELSLLRDSSGEVLPEIDEDENELKKTNKKK